jgi:transcriptional regulator with XRE-family HTH domain
VLDYNGSEALVPDPTLRLGGRIRYFRLRKGLTQEQLAEAAGISAVMVSRIEQGTRFPSTPN